MQACRYSVADLLPHKPPMVLIDEVCGWDHGRLEASVAIRPGIPFYAAARGVAAHIGIEYMAQSCGAYAGLETLRAGLPIQLGLLLGTRRYLSNVSWFEPGQQLRVAITELFRDGSIGLFDCRIKCEERILASAQLSVYSLKPGASLSGATGDEQEPAR